jgi:hypothetical protein
LEKFTNVKYIIPINLIIQLNVGLNAIKFLWGRSLESNWWNIELYRLLISIILINVNATTVINTPITIVVIIWTINITKN